MGDSSINPATSLTMLEQAKDGNQDAIAGLLAFAEPYVKNRLRKSTPNAVEDVDDLWQEISLRVWQSLGKFDHQGQGRFRAWVAAIARNLSHSKHAKESRRSEIVARIAEDLTQAVVECDLAKVSDLEFIRFLWKFAKEEFSATHSGVFESLAFEERDLDDVAARFDVSKENAMMIHLRIRRRLKEIATNLLNTHQSVSTHASQ